MCSKCRLRKGIVPAHFFLSSSELVAIKDAATETAKGSVSGTFVLFLGAIDGEYKAETNVQCRALIKHTDGAIQPLIFPLQSALFYEIEGQPRIEIYMDGWQYANGEIRPTRGPNPQKHYRLYVPKDTLTKVMNIDLE